MRLGREMTWKLIQFVQSILKNIPYKMAMMVGSFLGSVFWVLSKKRVDGAEYRCVKALGIGVSTARQIVRASYVNLGRSVTEFICLPDMISSLNELVTIHGEEHLKKAFDLGKGVIAITAHLGNWEMAAAAVAAKGYPMNAIGAEQRDERITDLIIDSRQRWGVTTVSKGFSLKAAMACLKRGEILAVLIDQDAKEKGVVAPFLGLPASTPYGPIKMSLKYGSPMIPVYIIRREDGIHHDLYFLPPFEDPSSEIFGTDLEKAVAICNNSISSWITKYPGQWMWLYPRWASTLGDK
ncbi:MAG TPA: lipid A biosynthesis acyltransferase [Aminobacterium sp.]|uniref:lysophospholipid acyltransferase family protein n=1 Tax=Aminobacterium TaxID=81466 RepID=UPI000ED2250B|nr:lysophospholipid acyltransferase family protein [Aminobacterium sp. UBA4834]HCA40562.1 lipid A biosynthesis acyltransferase [Aminobacterium sp.]